MNGNLVGSSAGRRPRSELASGLTINTEINTDVEEQFLVRAFSRKCLWERSSTYMHFATSKRVSTVNRTEKAEVTVSVGYGCARLFA